MAAASGWQAGSDDHSKQMHPGKGTRAVRHPFQALNSIGFCRVLGFVGGMLGEIQSEKAMVESHMNTQPPADATTIAHYHAHVYYDPAASRDRAERLRERIAARFPDAQLGRWHDVPVGPHPQAMYQVAFPAAILADLVPFLMLNRDGLAVLLHPETGDDYADHARHAVWFGEVLPLRLEMFAAHGA